MSARRLSKGGRIDRTKPLNMHFDGRALSGFAGDSLASAMLAGGETCVARSFKYHRPRGVYSAGTEEPNALVHLRSDARREPNTRATTIEAFDNLQSSGQNAWPNVRMDVGAINQMLGPFIGAGFYYKTFIGPFRSTGWWMFFEKIIRRAAGMGSAAQSRDPDSYEKVNAFCDVLVIGGGPAGLAAALAAGRKGAKVILAEQDWELGGSMLSAPVGCATDRWLSETRQALSELPNVQVMPRTTVFGAYDNGVYGMLERFWDHVDVPPEHQVRQRYWLVRAKSSVMATGAIERPMVFAGNDRPGVMLASAARTYVNRYGVLPGKRCVIATNNDSVYAAALDLANAGANVIVADCRESIPDDIAHPVQSAGIEVLLGHGVVTSEGRSTVKGARLAPVDENGRARFQGKIVECDLIATSSGWSPVVHLWSQRQQKPVFDPESASFVPGEGGPEDIFPIGAVTASGDLAVSIGQGIKAGEGAAAMSGADRAIGDLPSTPDAPLADHWARDIRALWSVTDDDGTFPGKAFVDLQHDVTTSDIDLAHREGYSSVEHLKRYTTTGMAADQGKLSNINALARMATLRGSTIPEVGTTTFRPPYTPITIGALAGREVARHLRPTRLTPIHDWHENNGAVFTDAGAWLRPQYYPEGNEDIDAAYRREARHVRQHVGLVDVSTLGKIAVQGPDAAEFLNRMYTNGWKTLAIGRLRYGVMLREDGIVLDDGVTARLGEFDYMMSTTTANAARILSMAEQLLQTAWRDLKVHVTSVSDQWAAIAVAGPSARALLSEAAPSASLSADALPNNHFTETEIDGAPVRIHRMSYSGELAYEVYVPSGFAHQVWEYLLEVGELHTVTAYGTESMGTLRIEKGHVAGPELDGRTTLKDMGLEGLASSKKPFVGSVLRHRPVLDDPSRPVLVGLEIHGDTGTRPGTLLFGENVSREGHGEGWVSSTTFAPALGKYIALGFLTDGASRYGETVRAVDFVGQREHKATVVSPHFFDPEGKRQNA